MAVAQGTPADGQGAEGRRGEGERRGEWERRGEGERRGEARPRCWGLNVDPRGAAVLKGDRIASHPLDDPH